MKFLMEIGKDLTTKGNSPFEKAAGITMLGVCGIGYVLYHHVEKIKQSKESKISFWGLTSKCKM